MQNEGKLQRGRARFVGLVLLVALGGCESRATPSGDSFAIGTQPLALKVAPGGLCEGGGADKECGPEGCIAEPSAADLNAGSSTGTGSFGNSASPSSSGFQPGGSALPQGMPSSPPVGVAPPQPMASAGSGATEPVEQPQDPDCTAALDGGAPTAGAESMCEDAGVGVSASALIGDDVPACATIDASKASTLFMSADDSSSMAGPAIARRMIRARQRVPAHILRPWEFLNYYDFSFEPSAPGGVRVVPQLSSCPEHDRLSLQVALQAEARDPDNRAPLSITFVIDTSGSMASNQLGGDTPIAIARRAVLALASRLRSGDVVSMVTWNVDQLVILAGHEITGPNDMTLVNAALGLEALGGTDLHSGLVRGYELAERFYAPERINRVILISDGVANVGVTDEELIAQHSDDEEGEAGIYLAGLGVGDGFNDTLMNTVTDAGRGAYVYLDSESEAQRMMADRYLQVVDVAARDVRLEVTLPHYLVLEKFYGEVVSTDAAKVRPQHLGPNDAMLFFQVLRACDPSLLHGDDRIHLRATWQTPFERERREQVIDTTLNALAGDDEDMSKAAAIAAYAEALLVAATSADNNQAREALLHAIALVRAAKNADTDPDLVEVGGLLTQYAELFPVYVPPVPVTMPAQTPAP